MEPIKIAYNWKDKTTMVDNWNLTNNQCQLLDIDCHGKLPWCFAIKDICLLGFQMTKKVVPPWCSIRSLWCWKMINKIALLATQVNYPDFATMKKQIKLNYQFKVSLRYLVLLWWFVLKFCHCWPLKLWGLLPCRVKMRYWSSWKKKCTLICYTSIINWSLRHFCLLWFCWAIITDIYSCSGFTLVNFWAKIQQKW